MDAILARRWMVVAFCVALTLVAGIGASRLEFDSSIEIWFLEGDPEIQDYHEFLDRFEADEISVVAVFAPDVFTPEVLAAVERLTAAAESAPFAHRVLSLTNVRIPTSDEDTIAIAPLMETIPESIAAAADVRERALANPLLPGGLVAADGRATAIVIELARAGADFAGKMTHVAALEEAAAHELDRGIDVRLTGTPPFDAEFFRLSRRDFVVLGPVAVLAILLSVLVVFRRFSAVIVPAAVVLMSVVWVFGLMAVLGLKINVLTSGLTAVILAVGIADSIHVLSDYYQELMVGMEPRAAVRQSILNLLVPCFVTSATTAIGMLALLTSSLQPVREFGALAAVGVVFAFGLTITFVPTLLSLVRPPDPAYIDRQRDGPMSRLILWLGRVSPRRSRVVVAITLPLMGLVLLGIRQLEIGANTMNYFPEASAIRRDTTAVDAAMGGSATIEMLVTAADEGFKDPVTLERLDRLERWLERERGITKSMSIVDSLQETHRVFRGGEAESFRVPDSRALVAQLFLLLEGEDDFEDYLQDDYSVGRITSRVQMSEAAHLAHALPRIERGVAEQVSDLPVDVEITGFVKLMNNMEHYLLESQIVSLTVAFVVVTLTLMALFRSVRLGLFSMIPNFLPVVIGLAFMGAFGIDLDPGTIMIGAMALGLVVDDTVHLLVRLRRRVAGGLPLEAAIGAAMSDAGRPIIVTSLLLMAGFSILALGSFSPNIFFGLVSAWVVGIALVADLLVLPAALVLVRPRL